ncbi:hypothetical protein O181_121654 [Austropuccinia psidii MF-1]|uniref:Uncharacterized protein n=1 Tax=Austropuccinia psidii MF-1 TaxID=1389203 RepID=A0A9Q3KJ18_9BASI|nr:hypothetical protein [Austropuccinia psidii MF-1]
MSWRLLQVEDKQTAYLVSIHHLKDLDNWRHQPNPGPTPDPLDTHTQACIWLHGQPNGLALNTHVATAFSGALGYGFPKKVFRKTSH